jgi:DNA end-binding protein Ku
MARAVWTGSLSFGLVNVPVALFTATEEKSIRFNQFQAGTSDRVRMKRVNERSGDEVPYSDIVKGYDLGAGEYVILTPEEVAGVAPGRSQTIDVSAFVDLDEIDPVYFDRPYYLAPPSKGSGKGGERAYALLRDAMAQANKVALATFVMRERQYLVAVRPRQDVLVLETLRYADEVRDPAEEIDTVPVEAGFDQRELEMARMLIDSMSATWEPEQYRDVYRERLEDLIERKRAGGVTTVEQPEPQAAPVVDLLQALEASLAATRGAKSRGGQPGAATSPGSTSPRSTSPGSTSPRSTSPGSTSAKAPRAGAGSRTGRGDRPPRAGAAEDLASLGKAELQRRASDLDIPGRSKMNREELVDAIGAASGRRRKAS